MLSNMSTQQLDEWIAYHNLEPFGSEKEDSRFALLATLLVNTHSKKKVKPSDFMPKRAMTSEEMKRVLRGL